MATTFTALLAQSADAATTCHALHRDGARELNPVYGQSCTRVVAIKSAAMTGLFPHKRTQRWLAVFAIVNGATGATVNLTRTW